MTKKFFVESNDEVYLRLEHIDQLGNENPTFKYSINGNILNVSDEYHTMHELYQHRMALTIALFNTINSAKYWEVIKSKLHHDGTMFEGDYFIVMLLTDFGQISYHYHMKHWDKFQIPVVERAPQWDGHTSLDVLARLERI